jgi:cholesterol oxidase
MPSDFDAIVIGSGFGGAICSARLAEAGYRVLILERGRRWDVQDFPRKPDDAWTWDHDHPERKHGWFDFRVFPNMTVVQGAGVGGGSLVYANISVPANEDTFASGWPSPITFGELQPHYERVGKTMNVKAVPEQQWPARTRLLKEAAEKLGYGDRFRRLELAVTFDDTWTYDQANPHDPAKSKPVVNAQGQTQGTCVHLGDCDIGCEVRARNTLDLNYIPIAEQHGAVVKPLHIVRTIKPTSDGYEVSFHEIANGALVPGTATGRLVIVAAGSLGSTELLLKCRADASALPNISATLGHRWSSKRRPRLPRDARAGRARDGLGGSPRRRAAAVDTGAAVRVSANLARRSAHRLRQQRRRPGRPLAAPDRARHADASDLRPHQHPPDLVP